jgi:hypothetical protein
MASSRAPLTSLDVTPHTYRRADREPPHSCCRWPPQSLFVTSDRVPGLNSEMPDTIYDYQFSPPSKVLCYLNLPKLKSQLRVLVPVTIALLSR